MPCHAPGNRPAPPPTCTRSSKRGSPMNAPSDTSPPAPLANGQRFPIPARLNLVIAAGQFALLAAILIVAGHVSFWPWVPVLALGYALLMNSAYLMLHEAEHGMLHPHRAINDA